ncbi:MAG: Na+/H+ antiporter subunit E [Desulfobacterales bacterium]|nr:Na+/H+ antiporter subunit E [Desulfobacterales bacterium]
MQKTPELLVVRGSWWRRCRGKAVQAVLLMAVWLILSGMYDFIHIFYGVISVAFVVWLNDRLTPLPLAGERCGERRIIFSRLLLYIPWLLWQIALSGIYVAGVVLNPHPRLAPTIVRFTSRQPGVVARVILGNSITLTPGTITLAINGDLFTVHALTADTAAGLISGDMESRVGRLYCEGLSPEDACCDVYMLKSRGER